MKAKRTPSPRGSKEDVAKLLVGLDSIWMICLDYDGETTIKGLKGLIDEVKATTVDIMHDKRTLPKNFKTWTAWARARGLEGLPE